MIEQPGGSAVAWQVLIVCTANRCRSPMAELLLARRLAAVAQVAGGSGGGRAVCVTSAGTRTVDGSPVTPETAVQLALRGLDAQGFRSRSLTDDMVCRADLVLTATRAHRSRVLERVPLALRRAFTLLEFAAIAPGLPGGAGQPGPSDLIDLVRQAAAARGSAALAEYDVQDPVGGPDEGFAVAAGLIERAVDRIAAALLAVQQR